jgi:glycosyltransferase involved in cell wall biosynthesis
MGVGARVIAVSAAVADRMAARGVPRRKLRVVLNGTLDTPRRDYFPRWQFSLKRPNLATLCGLHDRKGIRDLLNAFAIIAAEDERVHLYIAGDGPCRADYEAMAATLIGADRITFMGEVRDTKSFLTECEVFVLASHADPCPLVLPEAREAGCAIVATEVDGIPEALDGGRAGVLVQPMRPDALAAAVIELLGDRRKLAAQRAAAGADLGKWSIDRVAAETHMVYAELVGLDSRPADAA